jgi:hypothetical protein
VLEMAALLQPNSFKTGFKNTPKLDIVPPTITRIKKEAMSII